MLCGKRFCCLASTVAVQENDFAVWHRRFQDCIWFCCPASAVAVQETILLFSISVSQTTSGFAVQHPPLRYRKRFCCLALAFPRLHLVLPSSIRRCGAGNDFAV